MGGTKFNSHAIQEYVGILIDIHFLIPKKQSRRILNNDLGCEMWELVSALTFVRLILFFWHIKSAHVNPFYGSLHAQSSNMSMEHACLRTKMCTHSSATLFLEVLTHGVIKTQSSRDRVNCLLLSHKRNNSAKFSLNSA